MSYCRFQNTLPDLRDCEEAMENMSDMSDEEKRAKKRLINLCIDIAMNYGPSKVSNALFAISDKERKLV